MLRLAVVGKDVSKSDSPAIHRYILGKLGVECSYERISVSPAEFSASAGELFHKFDAFNVTIPFKGEIIPFLNDLRGDARRFGAVNTVVSDTRTGYNTDGDGFLLMLKNEDMGLKNRRVLVLGAGGAGRSCIAKLRDEGANVFAFERNAERLLEVCREIGGFQPLDKLLLEPFDVIVNATGVGMHDTVGQSPVSKELIELSKMAVDLIYVPRESEFLKIARELGKKTVNGAAMLFYQAYFADCIYLNRQPAAAEAKLLWQGFSEENE